MHDRTGIWGISLQKTCEPSIRTAENHGGIQDRGKGTRIDGDDQEYERTKGKPMSRRTSVGQRPSGRFSTDEQRFDFQSDLAVDSRIAGAENQFALEASDCESDVFAEHEPAIDHLMPPVECAIADEALMQAVSNGDTTALSTLYDRYAAIVKSITLRVVHDEAEAEDLLQEVFVQIWQHAKKYSSEKGKPFGWIVTLARRRAIDRLRKRQAYSRAKDRFEIMTNYQQESRVHNRIEADIRLSDMKKFLKFKLEALPAFQRQAIEMVFFGGMSQREIALTTGTPLGTIKTRLELGLKKLSDSIHRIKHMI